MGEIRCPMCGKSNPEDLENCQFCDARLKPLLVSESPQPTVSAQDEQPSTQDDSPDDWLSLLRDSDSGDNAEMGELIPEDQPLESDELPDWLDSLRNGESEEPPAVSPEPTAAESAPDITPQEEEPDWLLSAELPDEEYVPDWLAQVDPDAVQESQPPPQAETPEEGAPEPAEELNWLQRIRMKRQEEVVNAETEEASLSAEEPSVPEMQAAGESAMPESGLPAEAEAPLEGEPAAPQQPVGLVPAEQALVEQGPAEAAADREIPDWLAGIVAGKAIASAETGADADAEGLPDWLADLDRSPSQDPGVIVPFGEEEPGLTFDWLQEQVRADQGLAETELAEDQAGAEAGKVEPFVGDLSDFLEEEYLAAPESEQAAAAVPAEDLAPAELPNWLEAMRPLGAAALGAAVGEADAQVEASGPLAGLRGVVPAEPDIARLKKPPAYTIRMQVSDTQQANAIALEKLVRSEGEARPVAGRPAITSQHVWRAIIFFVLVAVVAWAAITRSQDTPLPSLLPEVLDASAAVDGLPANPVVLLAVDYEAGYAGEMRAVASAMVDHLILKGAYLALVSTSPTGVALGEELVQQVSGLNGFPYQEISQYANLGYIPANAAGLLGFAQAPRQFTPYALDVNSTDVWSQGPLQAVQNISDFDLVAVLTEDSDKARGWIEQVQPQMESKPLIMVLSAQAEPMVRPYYQSDPNAVTGMVAGLVGGGSYENAHPDLMGGEGPARLYWDAFSSAMLAALILIGIGVLVDLSLSAVKNRKQEDGEEQK